MKTKRFFCVIMLCALSLAGCSLGGQSKADDIVSFDLSKYDNHGNVSCGRIWVERTTEGDWDEEGEGQFAYFDTKGNQITSWFNEREYNVDYLDDELEIPDYINNFLILNSLDDANNDNDDEPEYNCIEIYNIDGKFLGKRSLYNSDSLNDSVIYSNNEKEALIKYFDCGKNKYSLVKNDGIYNFTGSNLDYFEDNFLFEDSYCFDRVEDEYINVFLIDHKAAIFSSRLTHIYTVNEKLNCNYVYEVKIESENIVVDFEGQNGKRYTCVLDRDGNFVKKPFLSSN